MRSVGYTSLCSWCGVYMGPAVAGPSFCKTKCEVDWTVETEKRRVSLAVGLDKACDERRFARQPGETDAEFRVRVRQLA